MQTFRASPQPEQCIERPEDTVFSYAEALKAAAYLYRGTRKRSDNSSRGACTRMTDHQSGPSSGHSANVPITLAAAAPVLLTPIGVSAAPNSKRFQADLMPLNALVGGAASGMVVLTVESDALTIDVDVKGLSPGMHMIHIHGFTTGDKAASCASAAQDKNGDGIIDIGETVPVSGTTLIPFTDEPATLKIASDSYPKSGAGGELKYRATVSVAKLDAALKKQFGIDGMHLDRRVIYVHGVPDSTHLPATVKSLPGVPANLTLPVSCGTIRASQ